MTGEIIGREKYGEISLKPPIFHSHNFTCDFCFVKFFLNFKMIYSFLSVPDHRCICQHYDQWWYLSFHSQIEKSFQFIIIYFYGQLWARKSNKFSDWINSKTQTEAMNYETFPEQDPFKS